MNTHNAIKSCEKAGGTRIESRNNRLYSYAFPGSPYRVEFIDKEGSAMCIGTRRHDNHSDPMSDYCATSFHRNMKSAIAYAMCENLKAGNPAS